MIRFRTRGKSELILALFFTQLAVARGATTVNLPTPQSNTRAVTITSLPINFEPNRGQTTERIATVTAVVTVDSSWKHIDIYRVRKKFAQEARAMAVDKFRGHGQESTDRGYIARGDGIL
jgi:hypothetical protein